MSAAPRWLRPVWVQVWVWVSLGAVVRLSSADGGRIGGLGFSVPVWKFVKATNVPEPEAADGAEAPDFGCPQCRCGFASLSVRFSLLRHSDLRLEDGSRLLSLPDVCGGSVRTFGPWLLLTLPYTSCHMALWTSNGTWFRQLKLRYFDHLLQEIKTGVATCENPATSLQPAPPLVTCGKMDVTVKLPFGARLKRIKALGKDGIVGRALTTTTSGAAYVQISTPVETDSIFEVNYFDSAGEMSTMLAACFNATKKSGRHPRALEEPDLWELWDFEEIPLEPFIPEPTEPFIPEPTEPFIPEPTETTPHGDEGTTVVTQVIYADAEIFELWGFDEIPDRPYTGDQTTLAPSTTSTSTAASTTSVGMTTTTGSSTTTSAPTTTSAAPPTTTAAPTTTTSTSTSAAPTTATSAAPTTTSSASTTMSVAPTTATSSKMTSAASSMIT